MNNTALEVPWAATPPTVAPHPRMDGVNVLPGYPTEATSVTPATLSTPWSGRTIPVPPEPSISSLREMALS